MNIIIIALKNLKIRIKSYIFSGLILLLGVTSFVTFSNIITAMNLELGDRIDEFGANAIVYPNANETIKIEDLDVIWQSEIGMYLNILSPKTIGQTKVNDIDALIVGILPEYEFAQKPWLTMKNFIGADGSMKDAFDFVNVKLPQNFLILGEDIAEVIDADIKDEIMLGDENFTVYGILEKTGGDEDGLIFADLKKVQNLLGKPEELTIIEVSAYCNACPIEEIAMGIEDSLVTTTAIPLRQASVFREETIDKFSGFGFLLTGIILVVSILTILKTVISSVNQRTREIGIFRAIGFSSFNIVKIIILEVGILSLVAGILGFAAGSIIFVFAGSDLANLQSEFTINFNLLLPSIFISVAIATAAGIYPAIKAAKLDPAQALRFI